MVSKQSGLSLRYTTLALQRGRSWHVLLMKHVQVLDKLRLLHVVPGVTLGADVWQILSELPSGRYFMSMIAGWCKTTP